MSKCKFLLIFLLLIPSAYASNGLGGGRIGSHFPPVGWREEATSEIVRPRIIVVDVGTITDNLDGTMSYRPASADVTTNNYVPYTGAIKSVNLGTHTATADTVHVTGGNIIVATPVREYVSGYFSSDVTFNTTQGTNTDTRLVLKGKGVAGGMLDIFDQDDSVSLQMICWDDIGYIYTHGTSPSYIDLQSGNSSLVGSEVRIGDGIGSAGRTAALQLQGYPTGAAGTATLRIDIQDTSADAHFVSSNDTVFAPTGGEVKIEGGLIIQSDKYVVCTTFTSAGINTAIDALGTEGGEVYLPEGDYDVTATIAVDYNNTTIRGAGKGTRLLHTNRFVYTTVAGTPAAGETLDGDTNGYTATCVQVDTTNKIVWYHSISNAANYEDGEVISWSGGADTTISGAPTEPTTDTIDFGSKTHITITDLCIYGGAGANEEEMLITGSGNNATVRNCFLYYGDGAAVQIIGDYQKIQNNYIIGQDEEGIVGYGMDNSIISGNYIEDCGTTYPAIGVPVCSNIVVSNNILKNNAGGIQLTTVAHAAITGNVIQTVTAGYHGIELVTSCTYCAITGNDIYDVGSGGADIKLNTADYTTVVGNNCYGDGTSDMGIHLDESDYCTVIGNFSTNHDVAGIQEDSDCQNNIIAGNNVQDTTPYALSGTAAETFDMGQSSIKTTDTATADVVDARYIEYSTGGAPTVRDALAIGSGKYTLPDDTPDDNEILKYNLATKTLGWEADAGGAAEIHERLVPQTAKFPTSNPAFLDAGNSGWRLLFDSATSEFAAWEFALDDDYGSGTLYCDIYFSMLSGEANEVEWECYVMAYTPATDSADWDTDDYDTVNEGDTPTTVAATAGRLYKQTITLTNDDSLAAGDMIRIKISTDADDADADDALGDREFRYGVVRE